MSDEMKAQALWNRIRHVANHTPYPDYDRLAAGKITGRRINPETGETVEVPEHEHFYRCEVCGAMVDKRDLAAVLAHEGPLPHPEGSKVQ